MDIGLKETCGDGFVCENGACAEEAPPVKAGDLVITEVMFNPVQVIDSKGEWIELYNTTNKSIDLRGLTLQDAGTDPHLIIIRCGS
ncbi:MAG TPA: lamin tail domain-containing protein, partial [Myxococcales bacterium]|nr:lamin tail domain-containing protein [Myxococcales bacterium]